MPTDTQDRIQYLKAAIQVVKARTQAINDDNDALRLKNQELREKNQKMRESLAQMVREQAERDGVFIPDEVVEDSSPASMAVRCQCYIVTYSGNHEAVAYWKGVQETWFRHHKFDRSEFDRLCNTYGIA